MKEAVLESEVQKAVRIFWKTRSQQSRSQALRNVSDQGTRGAVTGGKQLDGFVDLLRRVTIAAGVPEKCIFTKNNELPGFFRSTKEWDFLVISPKHKLVACIELKSQVGSFGNNFNNRTEEALGSALDIWTAFREGAFLDSVAPWLGYLMVVEKCPKSTTVVSVSEPHFKVMKEFVKTSYLDRYKILCTKMIRERIYTQCALLWTSMTKPNQFKYGYPEPALALTTFVESYTAYLKGRMNEFK